jgi:hypothetical protein
MPVAAISSGCSEVVSNLVEDDVIGVPLAVAVRAPLGEAKSREGERLVAFQGAEFAGSGACRISSTVS